MTQCPCESGKDFDLCCGPILDGAPAATPEALMRSRYTAFTMGRVDHLDRTLAPEKRDEAEQGEQEKFARDAKWLGLEIRAASGGGPEDRTGTVEYVARFKFGPRKHALHELAEFRRDAEGRWLYVDGELNPKGPPRRVEKIGRNDPCGCGSGKKFKKCCGATAP